MSWGFLKFQRFNRLVKFYPLDIFLIRTHIFVWFKFCSQNFFRSRRMDISFFIACNHNNLFWWFLGWKIQIFVWFWGWLHRAFYNFLIRDKKVLKIIKELLNNALFCLIKNLIHLIDLLKGSNVICWLLMGLVLIFLYFFRILKSQDELVLHINEGFDEIFNMIFVINWFEKIIKLWELSLNSWIYQRPWFAQILVWWIFFLRDVVVSTTLA